MIHPEMERDACTATGLDNRKSIGESQNMTAYITDWTPAKLEAIQKLADECGDDDSIEFEGCTMTRKHAYWLIQSLGRVFSRTDFSGTESK